MRSFIHPTSHDAYNNTLFQLIDYPEFISHPRDLVINEILNYSFEIAKPNFEAICTKCEVRNKEIADYTAKEFELYESGTNLATDFAEASKFWCKIANSDGTVNSAYGYLLFKNKSLGNPGLEFVSLTPDESEIYHGESLDELKNEKTLRSPWDWAKQSLIADHDTRQAVLPFALPQHFYQGNKDVTCTVYGHFFIRANKLNFSVKMRSNDCIKGLVYDLSWFIYLQHKMCQELLETYPELEVGTYHHHADSMHLYQKDLAVAKRMLGI